MRQNYELLEHQNYELLERQNHEQLERQLREKNVELQQMKAQLRLEIKDRLCAEKALRISEDRLKKLTADRSCELGEANRQSTERQQAEEALRESEARFRSVLDNSIDVIYRLNIQTGHFEYVSPSAETVLGYTPEKYMAMSSEEALAMIYPNDLPAMRTALARLYETGKAEAIYRQCTKSGEYRWISDYMSLTLDSAGQPLYRNGNIRDMTARMWVEEEYRRSNERFRNIFSNNMVPMAIWKKSGEIVKANEALLDLIGYTYAEVEDDLIRWTKLTSPEYAERDLQAIAEIDEKGFCTPYKKLYRHKDGHLIPILFGGGIFDDNQEMGVLFAIDLTEQNRMEQALRNSKELQAYLLRLSDSLRSLSDAKSIQDTAAHLLAEHLSVSQATYCEYIEDSIVIHNETPNDAKQDLTVAGTANISVPLVKEGRLAAMLTVSQSNPRAWTPEEVESVRETAERTWAAVERARIEEALFKAIHDKNETLQKSIEMKDEFLSIVSHEFKTPLTVINSAVQTMRLICRDELSDKANQYLARILQNSNRQLKLVNNLLDITRINAGNIKINLTNIDIINMTRTITESIMIFAEQKGIRLSFSSTLGEKIIGIDEEKYERILLNLLSNAIKFTPRGKSIFVRAYQKVVKGKCKVCIQVRDQGIGIPHDKQQLIFERFGQVDSSLSRQAEGTGIGLSLVKMLAEIMGGEITVESDMGEGSTFTVLFPVTKVKEMPVKEMLQDINDNRVIRSTAIEFSDIY